MIQEYSLSLVTLLKGILYKHQKEAWENLVRYEPEVKRYFLSIGLDIFIDQSEGYAYLRQKEYEDETLIPRLSEKRQLNFFISLLCLVLRKYVLEQDAQGGTVRAIITQQEIISRTKVFLPSASDEAKQEDKVITTINKVIEIGFLRKLDDTGHNYEIHRIIKGFIDASVIDETLLKLERYAAERKTVD